MCKASELPILKSIVHRFIRVKYYFLSDRPADDGRTLPKIHETCRKKPNGWWKIYLPDARVTCYFYGLY